jgi:hypothetical protein
VHITGRVEMFSDQRRISVVVFEYRRQPPMQVGPIGFEL